MKSEGILIFCILFAIVRQFYPENCLDKSDSNEWRKIKDYCQEEYFYNNKICGIGIYTKTHSKCIKWKFSKYTVGHSHYTQNIFDDSIFCKFHETYYWCPTAQNNWQYCKNIKCEKGIRDSVCHSNIVWASSESSIEFALSNHTMNNNIIILMFSDDGKCWRSILCSDCIAVTKVIQEHFYSCESSITSPSISRNSRFEVLQQNKKYKFFLIPVINNFTLKTMAVVTLRTDIKFEKNNYDVQIEKINSTTITIRIKSQKNNFLNPEDFHVKITSNSSSEIHSIKFMNSPELTISTLQPCTKYCFVVSISHLTRTFILKAVTINTGACLDKIGNYFLLIKSFVLLIFFTLFILVIKVLYLSFRKFGCISQNFDLHLKSISPLQRLSLNCKRISFKTNNSCTENSNVLMCNKRPIQFYLEKDKFEAIKAEIIKEYTEMYVTQNNSNKPIFERGKKRKIFYIPFTDTPDRTEYIFYGDLVNDKIEDILSFVWELNISLIVVVKSFNGENHISIESLLNITYKATNFNEHDKYYMKLETEKVTDAYIERNFNVTNKKQREMRKITHFYITSWNEFSNPKFDIFERVTFRFHELISTVHNPPFLINCNSGFGRVNCFVAIDRIIRNLVDGETFVDVSKQMSCLLKNENFVTLQKSQYIFIHEFIQNFLQKYYVDMNLDKDNTYELVSDST